MTVSLNSGIASNIQSLLRTLGQVTGKDILLPSSRAFRATIESNDGQALNFRLFSLDQGLAENNTRGNAIASTSLVIPSGGPADLDGATGTAILVSSTVDVTVPTPDVGVAVPVGSSVYATVTTPGGVPKKLTAVRLSDTQIRVSSPGSGYGALLESAGATGINVAGTVDITLANVAGDRFAVVESAAGGSAADHFSVFRVNDTTVRVQAHDAAGALVAGNTSTVKTYNFGQAAHETSTVRWAVIRP